jgi:hypothetical protein
MGHELVAAMRRRWNPASTAKEGLMTTHRTRPDRWFHPLIAPAAAGLNRRRLLMLAGAGTATAAVLRPELRLVTAQTPEAPTPAATLSGDEDAVELLREAAATMAELESFRFEIETIRGESTILEGLTLESIEGAVRRPVDFLAIVTVGVPVFGTIEVTAVGVGGNAWIENPLVPDEWIALEGASDVVTLVNPDTVILVSVGLVQDARIDGEERVGGMPTTRVAGTIDFSGTAQAIAGEDTELPTELSSEPLLVLIWIDEQGRVVEIELAGQILTTESSDVVRVVRFFDFNEPVDIETPPA